MAIDGTGWDRLRHFEKRRKKVSKSDLTLGEKFTIVQRKLISNPKIDLRTSGLHTSCYFFTFSIEVARLGNGIGNRNYLFD